MCILIHSPIKAGATGLVCATEGAETLVDILGVATAPVGNMDSIETPVREVAEDSATPKGITKAVRSLRAITRTRRICPLRLRVKDITDRGTEHADTPKGPAYDEVVDPSGIGAR